jgi:MFS transporter, DHA1 family, multidrug resistance protein
VSFWAVASLAGLMLIAVTLAVPESLPAGQRHGGGLNRLLGATGQVLRHRMFAGYLVVFAFSMGTIFAYVATSAFVLQSMNGLSPVAYSADFAFNAVGLTGATLLAARLAGQVPTRVVVGAGLAVTGLAGAVLLAGALWFRMPHLRTVLAEYEAHYKARRPHRSRQLHPPRPDYPLADLSQEWIKRRPVLGGLINEYERAA